MATFGKSTAPRFKEHISDTPGPGHYETDGVTHTPQSNFTTSMFGTSKRFQTPQRDDESEMNLSMTTPVPLPRASLGTTVRAVVLGAAASSQRRRRRRVSTAVINSATKSKRTATRKQKGKGHSMSMTFDPQQLMRHLGMAPSCPAKTQLKTHIEQMKQDLERKQEATTRATERCQELETMLQEQQSKTEELTVKVTALEKDIETHSATHSDEKSVMQKSLDELNTRLIASQEDSIRMQSDYDVQVRTMVEVIATKENSRLAVTNELEEAQMRLGLLRIEHNMALQDASDITHQLEMMNSRKSELESSIIDLQQDIELANCKIINLEGKLQAKDDLLLDAEDELFDAQKESREYKDKIEILESSVLELQGALTENATALSQVQFEYDAAQQKQASLLEQIAAKASTNQQLECDLQTANVNAEESQQKIAALEQHVSNIKSAMEVVENALAAAKDTNVQLTAEVQASSMENAAVCTLLSEAEVQLREHKLDIAVLQGKLEQVQEQVHDREITLEQAALFYSMEHSNLEVELASTRSILSKAKCDKHDLESEVLRLGAELGVSVSTLQSMDAQCTRNNILMQELRDQVSDLTSELTNTQTNYESLRGNLTSVQKEMAQLQVAHTDLQSQYDQTTSTLENTRAELQSEKTNVAATSEQLQHTQQELAGAREQNAILKCETDTLDSKVHSLSKEIAAAHVSLHQQLQQLWEQSSQLEATSALLEKTQFELLSSRKNVSALQKQLNDHVSTHTTEKRALLDDLNKVKIQSASDKQKLEQRISNHEQDIENWQHRYEDLSQQLESARKQFVHDIGALTSKNSELMSERSDLQQAIEALRNSGAELRSALASTEHAKAAVEAELCAAVEAHAAQMLDATVNHEQVVSDYDDQVAGLEQHKQTLSEQVVAISAKYDEVNAELCCKKNILEASQAQVIELQSRLSSSLEEWKVREHEMSTEIEQMRHQVEHVNMQLDEKEVAFQQLQNECDDLSSQADVATAQVEQKQHMVIQLTTQLQDTREELQQAHEQSQAMVNKHLQDMENRERNMAAQEAKYVDLQTKFGEQSVEMADVQEKLDQCRMKLEANSNEFASLRVQLEAKASQLVQAQQAYSDAVARIAEVESTVAQVEIEKQLADQVAKNTLQNAETAHAQAIAEFEAKQMELNASVETKQIELSRLNAERTELASEVESLQVIINSLQGQLAESQAKTMSTKNEVEELHERTAEYHSQIQMLENNMSDMTESMLQSETRVDQLTEEKYSLQMQFDQARDETMGVRTELEQTNGQVQDLEMENETLRSRMRAIENANWEHKAHTLEKENEQLRAQLKQVQKRHKSSVNDMARAAGHQNLNQKIRLHLNIKRENDMLQKNNRLLLEQVRKMSEQLVLANQKLEKSEHHNNYHGHVSKRLYDVESESNAKSPVHQLRSIGLGDSNSKLGDALRSAVAMSSMPPAGIVEKQPVQVQKRKHTSRTQSGSENEPRVRRRSASSSSSRSRTRATVMAVPGSPSARRGARTSATTRVTGRRTTTQSGRARRVPTAMR
jgi:chromosome segregation ATPase